MINGTAASVKAIPTSCLQCSSTQRLPCLVRYQVFNKSNQKINVVFTISANHRYVVSLIPTHRMVYSIQFYMMTLSTNCGRSVVLQGILISPSHHDIL